MHFWFLVFFSSFIYSQTNGISYQAVILDPNGNTPLANQTICLQFKIINSNSIIDYQETITTSTDDFGMINTIIGSGIPTGGLYSTFNKIVWDETPKNLIVEVDLSAACSSFIEISNQPFTSVPYALYATNGGSTNLSFTASSTNGTVVSNTGDDAIIPLATDTSSGLLAPNNFNQLSNLTSSLANKQDVLVDAVNIKTINGNSIIGNGDLVVNGNVSQTITNDVTATTPSEDAVFDALDLKTNKNNVQSEELNPLALFKITPFTPGNETFGISFNSFANSGAGTGTYNHGTWLGYNTGYHSGIPVTLGKPSIMIGLEDNYFDHIGDLKFGTEFYVQGFSPNGSTTQFSRPYYARGAQSDDGKDWWTIISNIGSNGSDRNFTVREGLNNLFQITPTKSEFYTHETIINNLFRLQSGNFLLDNNRYFQIKNSAEVAASVMKVATDNTFYIGDIFNNLGGNVILRSGGISSLILNSSGNAAFQGTTTATSFIKSGGTSAQFLKGDGSIDSTIYQPLLTNPITASLTTGYLPKATGSSTLSNSAIIENGSIVSLNYPSTGSIDTRFSVSGSGNGGAGRGTALLINVPGSANSVNGVKMNAYTTGGATVSQSVDLAFDLASSGTLTERMRVKSNGNLLVGSTTDNATDKLQVNGSLIASSIKKSGATADDVLLGNGTTSSLAAINSTSNTYADGKVVQTITSGVTTTAPSQNAVFDALALKAPLASPTFTGAVSLPNTTSIGSVSNTELNYIDGVTSAIQTQLNTKLSSFGTGTTNYLQKVTGTNVLGNSSITDNGALVDISGAGTAAIDTRFSISGSGNGGAGRGTALLMNVPGSANSVNGVKMNAYTTNGETVSQSVDLAFDLASSGTLNERMRVKSNGNLLIGTTTDNATDKLQVNGSFTASSIKKSGATADDILLGSGTTSSLAAINSTSNTYADGKVVQTITSGVTITAPSQNAVFDALTLKAPLASPTFTGTVTSPSFIKSGGTSTQFLKADGSVDNTIFQPLLTNPITADLTAGYLPKATSASTLGNSAITENGSLVSLNYPGTASIDTRLSISNFGNGGAGRGTAIVMGVPGSSSNVDGVKINAYTVGGAVASQSADLAFDVALSGSLTERMRITSIGNALIGTSTDNQSDKLQVSGSVVSTQYKLSALNIAPVSSTSPGILGEIRYDENYMYLCVAPNTWKRSPLTTW